ncbi:hypothetical protein NDU88_002340 [Pleurodeles waltl]|uniref:Uncharacterized protein n=1 Tax=Pleurodeles waltl TaxID=8319 RepID=A0AAV7M0A2_PLEWA|nr:hypothetical protein NDU88_002340 [Pleurodeles waltl]
MGGSRGSFHPHIYVSKISEHALRASLKKRFSPRLQNAASARLKRQYTLLGILFSVSEGSEHAHHIASVNARFFSFKRIPLNLPHCFTEETLLCTSSERGLGASEETVHAPWNSLQRF